MKRVLVIENNRDMRKIVGDIPELSNCNVLTVNNRRTGIEVALREKPDLIISDFLMPVLDGYRVLHVHHAGSAARNSSVFILSAESAADKAVQTIEPKKNIFQKTDFLATNEQLSKMDFTPWYANGTNSIKRNVSGNDIPFSFIDNRNINRYKKKQIIYSEGNRPLHLFYIKKGIVKTYKCNADGKELITGIYGEGDYVGYVALLEESVYKDFAVAVEYAELAVIPKDDFELLMENNRQVAKKFINLLAVKVAEKEEMLIGLAYNSLRKKVADALILLSKKYKSTIKISRDNIAAIAGTATESLIRTLGEFKQEKLIDINDGIIIILNEEKLRKMMN